MIFIKQRVESKSQPYSCSKCLLKHGLPQVCLHACMLSHVRLFETLMDYAHQTPPSMEFSRQEYLNGFSFPSPEDLAKAGIEPTSLKSLVLPGGFFTIITTWEALHIQSIYIYISRIDAHIQKLYTYPEYMYTHIQNNCIHISRI